MSEVVGEAVVVVRQDESQLNLGGAGETAGKNFAGKFGGIMGKLPVIAGIAAVGAAVGTALVGGITAGLNLDAAQHKIQAQLGLTEDQAAAAGDVAGQLYADNFGGSLADTNEAVATVLGSIKGLRDGSEKDIKAASEAALEYAGVFDTELPDAVNAATQVINSGLAGDAVEAFDILTAASQRVPAALRQDLFDAATEYSKSFDQIGLSGEQAFGVLAAASDQGVFGLDKAGDAVKEFTIRSTDMSTSTKGAYKTLGLDAQRMANLVLGGGEGAAAATQSVVDGLLSIKDPAKQANTAIALFGTPLEDLGTKNIPAFLQSLSGTGDALGDVAGATQRAADTMYDTPLVQIQATFRSIKAAILDVAIGALPFIIDGFSAVTGVVQQVLPIVTGALLPIFRQFGGILHDTLLPALTTLGQVFQEKVLPTVQRVGEQIRTQLVPALQPLIDKVLTVAGVLLRLAAAILGKVLPPLFRFAGFLISTLVPAIIPVITFVFRMINAVLNIIGAVARAVGSLGKFAGTLRGAVSDAVSSVVSAVTSLPGKILALGGRMAAAGKTIIGKFVDGLKNAGGIISGIAGNVWDAVKSLINGAIDRLNSALSFKIGLPGPDINIETHIPHLQSGTSYAESGFYNVGEVGPERVYIPEGARVLTAAQTRQAQAQEQGPAAGVLTAAQIMALRPIEVHNHYPLPEKPSTAVQRLSNLPFLLGA